MNPIIFLIIAVLIEHAFYSFAVEKRKANSFFHKLIITLNLLLIGGSAILWDRTEWGDFENVVALFVFVYYCFAPSVRSSITAKFGKTFL